MILDTQADDPSPSDLATRQRNEASSDRGLPDRLRRQPRKSGRRFSFPVTTALDRSTFEVLNAVSAQRRVSRSLVVENILREWAEEARQLVGL